MNNPSFGAIFSGGGGPLLGARWAGLKVMWAIEPRKYFNIKTHRYNFPSVPWSDQIKMFFDQPTDILWGSPSCGEYSSGKRSSKNSTKLQIKEFDEFEYVQFVQEVVKRKPKIFILENIESVKNTIVFEGTHAGFILKHLFSKDEIELPGYYIEEHVIQPTEVGVAQIRKRIFTIGSLRPYQFMLKPPLEDKRSSLSTRAIFEKLDQMRKNGIQLPNDRFPKHDPVKIDAISRLKPGESYYGGTNQKRLDPDRPCPVIMSSGSKHIHPWEDRVITAREAASLMGYPDDYVFFGSDNSCFDQIGKGIVPQVAEFILKQISEYLIENRIEVKV